MLLHPLPPLGLHVVPLLLLVRVEERSDLRVGALVYLDHFGMAILLRKKSVLAQALHLGALGLKCILHPGLLIGGEFELFGQFSGAPDGIGLAVAPATIVISWAAAQERANGIMNRKLRKRTKFGQSLHDFTKRGFKLGIIGGDVS